MNCLLDTHAFLWFISGDVLLSQKSRTLIEDTNNVKFISIASLWEIAIKMSIGKLQLDFPFSDLKTYLDTSGINILSISFDDAEQVSQLSLNHRDPFDRILIAQALNRNLTIISKDQNFISYNVAVIW